MKKLFNLTLAAIIALSAAIPVYAASNMTLEQATKLAKRHVPAGSTHLRTENDDGRYEVKFYNEDKQERYEIDISKATEKIVSFDSERYNDTGSNTVKLSKEDVKKIVAKEFKNAEILSVKLDRDNGFKEYDVYFQTDKYHGDYVINPENGIVLNRDIRVGKKVSNSTASSKISYQRAIELALKQVPGATVTDADLDKENGVYFYEIELYKNGFEYDLAIDAKTEKVLWNSSHKDDWNDNDDKFDDDDDDDDDDDKFDDDDDDDDDKFDDDDD